MMYLPHLLPCAYRANDMVYGTTGSNADMDKQSANERHRGSLDSTRSITSTGSSASSGHSHGRRERAKSNVDGPSASHNASPLVRSSSSKRRSAAPIDSDSLSLPPPSKQRRRSSDDASSSSNGTISASSPPKSRHESGPCSHLERACIRCARRKIRCDRAQPCSSCVRFGVAHTCRREGESAVTLDLKAKTEAILSGRGVGGQSQSDEQPHTAATLSPQHTYTSVCSLAETWLPQLSPETSPPLALPHISLPHQVPVWPQHASASTTLTSWPHDDAGRPQQQHYHQQPQTSPFQSSVALPDFFLQLFDSATSPNSMPISAPSLAPSTPSTSLLFDSSETAFSISTPSTSSLPASSDASLSSSTPSSSTSEESTTNSIAALADATSTYPSMHPLDADTNSILRTLELMQNLFHPPS